MTDSWSVISFRGDFSNSGLGAGPVRNIRPDLESEVNLSVTDEETGTWNVMCQLWRQQSCYVRASSVLMPTHFISHNPLGSDLGKKEWVTAQRFFRNCQWSVDREKSWGDACTHTPIYPRVKCDRCRIQLTLWCHWSLKDCVEFKFKV